MKDERRIGRYIHGPLVGGEVTRAYLPQPLPPVPAIALDELYPLLDKATSALGRLDGMSMVLPDASLFLYMYVRKEAVLSSQIEGTQSSLSDLLLFESDEAPGVPMDDAREVSCYVSAMNFGLERMKELPLSLRLMREIHAQLMSHARGGDKSPGEFRTSQNWIGGTRPGNARFVPCPPDHLMQALGDLEKFLHDENVKLPILVKAGLAHVQFETIHPFLDGNGRLGRLLITFILCAEGVLHAPLLYLSLFLKANRHTYYDLLQSVRETGDWEAWLTFFLRGVTETANQATETARQILELFAKDSQRIETSGKSTAAVLKLHAFLQRNPVATASKMRDACGISLQTVLRALNVLSDLGIVGEVTGKERNRIFAYRDYLALLNQGTTPIDA